MPTNGSHTNRNQSAVVPDPKPAAAQQAREADVIEQCNGSVVLAGLAGRHMGKHASAGGFKHYRDRLLAQCGQPRDPIEIMLIEELVWAHFRLGGLHMDASNADSPEAAAVHNAAAVRLMAEVRKTALALNEYRSPKPAHQVTLIKNVAGGDQQIALLDPQTDGLRPEKINRNTKLESNLPHFEHEISQRLQPAPGGRREAEPCSAERLVGERPPEASQGCARRSPLDAINGSADNCG